MPNDSPFWRLLGSRKALVLLVALVALTVLCALGKVSSQQLLDFLKITVPAWMFAQGFEDGMLKPRAETPESQRPTVP